MDEKDLHDYTKWLMEVWNPNQLYIPFSTDAPRAYLDYKRKLCDINNGDLVLLSKRVYKSKSGEIKNGVPFDGKYYAYKSDC